MTQIVYRAINKINNRPYVDLYGDDFQTEWGSYEDLLKELRFNYCDKTISETFVIEQVEKTEKVIKRFDAISTVEA